MAILSDPYAQLRPGIAWLLALLLPLAAPAMGGSVDIPLTGTPAAPDSYEARVVAEFPPYEPQQTVTGVIRIWGHGKRTLPWMRYLVEQWEAEFQRFHPGISLRYEMHGTSSGIPALFTDIGDIAILGEEILPESAAAFERAKGYPPLGVEICTGSVDIRNFDYAQMFFVHADNPLTQLSLRELDAIFGTEHRRGHRNIRTWDELGLSDKWEGRQIIPYGWAIADSFGEFLQTALMEGSHRWNNELREYVHIYREDGSIYDHGQQVLDNLANDPFGIAVSNIRYANDKIKPLAIGIEPDGPFFEATKQTLVERTYPLTRTIPAVVDRPPGMPIEPKVREFLLFLLSREGQAVVNQDGRYLPLSLEFAAEQRRKLD